MKKLKTTVLMATAFLAASAAAPNAQANGTEIELKSIPSFLNRVFVPVVPGAANTFSIESAPVTEILAAPAGYRIERSGTRLRIHAPAGEAAGYAKVKMGGRELTLTLMNLVPYSSLKRGFLEGYRIGEYLSKPLKGLRQYERPKGFIRLTKANQDLWVSDRYRLRDFQCKLDGKSKFLIVRSEALVKLELLQHSLETRHGLKFDRFTIMSGYRTPYYNSMIGNETGYSRHLYGDAMDIYVDKDRNGSMDDINGDGRVDTKDAKFLLHVAEAIDKSSDWSWLKGGAGVYKANSAHGPYVHVDTRGYVARWGV
jgi:hypothetical protein